MKTLKISVLLLLLVRGLLTNEATAQQGAYVNLNFGYNFSLNSMDFTRSNKIMPPANGSSTSLITSTDTTWARHYEGVSGSLGKGITFGVAFGFMFGDNVGAELGLSKLMGSTIETRFEDSHVDLVSPTNSFSDISTSKISGSMLHINPSIVLSTGKTEGLNLYGKFGLVIGVGSILVEKKWVQTNSTKTTTNEREWKMDGGMALGFSAAIGTNYSFNEKMSLFGELNMISMTYAPSKGELTKWTNDGVDMLVGATIRQKETEYLDSYDISSEDNFPTESMPQQSIKTPYSFGSLGVKIGIRYAF